MAYDIKERCAKYYREHRGEALARSRKRQHEHREEVNSYNVKYRAEHREKVRAYDAKSKLKHREEVLAREREYYHKNRDRELAHRKKYRAEHLEECLARSAEYNLKHHKEQRDKALMKNYKITNEDYERMFAKQGGVCAICGSLPNGRDLSVDHDHTTGRIRGLLCINCNTALGHLKDSLIILEKMTDYLQQGGTNAVLG